MKKEEIDRPTKNRRDLLKNEKMGAKKQDVGFKEKLKAILSVPAKKTKHGDRNG